MKITAVIAEFNPFHPGHAYLAERAREESDADIVIALMSGSFVQRGEPAVFDMGVRTYAALKGGFDMVFELPPDTALSSAEGFAAGAVNILNSLNIDNLFFGSESGDIALLQAVSDIISDEGDAYKAALKDALREGNCFPSAREAAVKACITSENRDIYDNLHEILQNPNNILALEYLKALKKSASSIRPFTTKRILSSYHGDSNDIYEDNTVSAGENNDPSYSAGSIRKRIFNTPSDQDFADLKGLDYIPAALAETGAVRRDALTSVLLYRLLQNNLEESLEKALCPPDLKSRILNNRRFNGTFSEFCLSLKTKNITYTAVSRHLLHMLLDMDYKDLYTADHRPSYLRLLGFNKNAEAFFNEIKSRSDLTIISNSRDIRSALQNAKIRPYLEDHLRIDEIYNTLRSEEKRKEHPLPPEISRKIIII